MRIEEAMVHLERAINTGGSRAQGAQLVIQVQSPGSAGATPCVPVEAVVSCIDWDAGKILLVPEQPLSVAASGVEPVGGVRTVGGYPDESDPALQPDVRLDKQCREEVAAAPAVQSEREAWLASLFPEDRMFEEITSMAARTYRRHCASARGQQISAADGMEHHLIWATKRWIEINEPSPATARTEQQDGKS